MSNKVKSINSSKKIQNSLPMKDIIQQNQLSNELLKIIVARSEDIIILKSISDRKTGKLRLQSAFAEKTLQEIESKEDWRLMREDQILSQLTNSRVEAALHKKQFEKLIRKMMKVNTQVEDDPNESEMNLTEINVQKIMNIKIGPENTFITYNSKGQPCVTVPSGSIAVSSWRDNYAKPNKIIESLLSGEVLNIYPATYFCTRYSRSNISQEISRQKLALEQGNTYLSPNIAVIITSKKSKPSINLQKSPSPVRKIVSLPEPDYKTPIFNFFFDLNSDIHKKIKDFKLIYTERSKENRVSKFSDKVEKALRIRNYEKCPAVKPTGYSTRISLNTVRTRGHLTAMPQIVFDLDNPYFEESKTLADRVKVIHFCIAVQKRFRYKKNLRLAAKAVIIQRHFRGFIVRKKIFLQKIQKFRMMFHWSRLKHWYPLLVNTFREQKSDFILMDYTLFLDSIIKIQKIIRGALVRKKVINWKKELAYLKKNKESSKLHQKKLAVWKVSLNFETDALNFSQKSEDEITNTLKSDEKILPAEAAKSSEKNEAEIRRVLMGRAKFERLKVYE